MSAAPLIGFDDQHAARHAADNSVAPRKILFVGGRAEGEFTHHPAVLGDLPEERFVLGWVRDIDAASEDGDRPALKMGNCRAMRGAIDSTRSAADDVMPTPARSRRSVRPARGRNSCIAGFQRWRRN